MSIPQQIRWIQLKHLLPMTMYNLSTAACGIEHTEVVQGCKEGGLLHHFDGLFRQSWSGTGTGNGTLTAIMLFNSHCNGNGTGTGNLRACLRVLNKDPNNPHGFVYIMLANDVTLV